MNCECGLKKILRKCPQCDGTLGRPGTRAVMTRAKINKQERRARSRIRIFLTRDEVIAGAIRVFNQSQRVTL
jgi:hypothetical protein